MIRQKKNILQYHYIQMEEQNKLNIYNIHTLDLLFIDRMLQTRQFNSVKEFLNENNIEINNFKFLKHLAEFKDIEMITYFKNNCNADFLNTHGTYYNITLPQYYLYMNKSDMLDIIYDACDVSSESQNDISATLPQVEQIISLNNACGDSNYNIRKQLQ